MKKTEMARKLASKLLNRRYGYGYAWTWGTILDGTFSEDFNDPYLLDKGKDLIDGGAAYGFWTVRASKYFDNVYSFEPDPRVYPHLIKNIDINALENVHALPYALGEVDASSTSFFQYGVGSSSFLTQHMGVRRISETYHVPQIKVDTIVKRDHLTPSVVKLDVEGAELQVLEGSRETLEEFKPTLIIEVHDPVTPEQIEEAFPEYVWKRRLRFLNTNLYPFQSQTHLLGTR